jgi:hypothetical protein
LTAHQEPSVQRIVSLYLCPLSSTASTVMVVPWGSQNEPPPAQALHDFFPLASTGGVSFCVAAAGPAATASATPAAAMAAVILRTISMLLVFAL